MFENRDYIALSVSDDSVRKKSLKRVSSFSGKYSEVHVRKILICVDTLDLFIAMEPAVKVPEEPRYRGYMWSHLHDFHPYPRPAEDGWFLQLFSCTVSDGTYQ